MNFGLNEPQLVDGITKMISTNVKEMFNYL